MGTLDPVIAIESAIYSALSGNAALTALIPARGIYRQDEKKLEEVRQRLAPADFPRVEINHVGETVNDVSQTFGMRSSVGACDYGVPVTIRFDIVVTHDKRALSSQRPVERAIQAAIHGLGVKAGLAWVTKWTCSNATRRLGNAAGNDNQPRTVWTWPLTFTCLPWKSDIT